MNVQHLLNLYLEQFVMSGRNLNRRDIDLRRYLSFCSEKFQGKIDYTSLQSWLKFREATLNARSLATEHNKISAFANWARLLDQSIGAIPKARKVRQDRRKPIILEKAQVSRFMATQRAIPSRRNINPVTFATITGLLFSTGLRVGEALNLCPTQVNLQERTIYVPSGKGPRDRTVGISKGTCARLQKYKTWADGFKRNNEGFFIYDKVELKDPYSLYSRNVRTVARHLGLRRSGKGRIRSNFTTHDLRHSFAVNSLIKIYESDTDVNEAIVELSSVLGHSSLDKTYWYIESVPRLVAAAFGRGIQ